MFVHGTAQALLIGWGTAAVLGCGSLAWLMRRAGASASQIGVVFVVYVASLIVGSKLLYLFEAWPSWVSDRNAFAAAVLSPRLRIPGGFFLVFAISPPLARLIGLRYAPFADTVTPAAGLVIFGIRIGCFLGGCCFGTPTSLPWAVSFPSGWTEVYCWQVLHGLILFGAPSTVPVHPLQLYFAMVGLLLFAGLTAYRRHVRYDGEVLLLFVLSYLWSTWLLELLRAEPHEFTRHVVLVASVAVTVLATAIEWRLRVRRDQTFSAAGIMAR